MQRPTGSSERLTGRVTLLLGTALVLTGALLPLVGASRLGQSVLLVHTAAGAAAILPAALYLAAHLGRLWTQDRGASRRLATLATLVLVATLGSGAWLAAAYAAGAAGPARLPAVHVLGAILLLALVPVHVVTTMARRPERLALLRPGALGFGALGVTACATALVAVLLPTSPAERTVPGTYPRTPDGGVFSASFTQTAHGGFVPEVRLTGSEACGTCHQEIFAEWAASAHRFSGVDNPLIAAATRPAEDKGGIPAARFCASCHEPVALLSGAVATSSFDLPAGVREQGVTCLVCHGVQSVPGLRGNGEMVYAPPDPFAFFNTGSPWGDAANRLLVRGFVDAHRAAMRPPLMSNSHQCSSCHTVNAHDGLNGTGFVRLHNENDDWRVSAFAQGVGDGDTVVRCQDCHMGQVTPSADPVARRTGGRHRSHRFVAANTFLAEHFGDPEQRRQTERFLRGDGVPAEIRHLIPAGPPVTLTITADDAVAGAPLAFAVTLTNRGVGHAFPAGPNEVNETWVEVTVQASDGTALLHSGALDPAGARDPDAFALISIPVDADGAEVFTTGGLAAGFRLRRAILHGASDRHDYRVALPSTVAGGSVTIAARLRYRKSDAPFAALLDDFTIADVPITDVAAAERTLPVHVARPAGTQEAHATVPARGVAPDGGARDR